MFDHGRLDFGFKWSDVIGHCILIIMHVIFQSREGLKNNNIAHECMTIDELVRLSGQMSYMS